MYLFQCPYSFHDASQFYHFPELVLDKSHDMYFMICMYMSHDMYLNRPHVMPNR